MEQSQMSLSQTNERASSESPFRTPNKPPACSKKFGVFVVVMVHVDRSLGASLYTMPVFDSLLT